MWEQGYNREWGGAYIEGKWKGKERQRKQMKAGNKEKGLERGERK